jgi:hypothetical protein
LQITLRIRNQSQSQLFIKPIIYWVKFCYVIIAYGKMFFKPLFLACFSGHIAAWCKYISQPHILRSDILQPDIFYLDIFQSLGHPNILQIHIFYPDISANFVFFVFGHFATSHFLSLHLAVAKIVCGHHFQAPHFEAEHFPHHETLCKVL